jgi:hypothetical protein
MMQMRGEKRPRFNVDRIEQALCRNEAVNRVVSVVIRVAAIGLILTLLYWWCRVRAA